MALRTVRLNPQAEQALRRIVRATGLTTSAALNRGLLALSQDLDRDASRTPYAVYVRLDLGPGGYAIAPSTDTRGAVGKAIRRKLGRAR